MGPRNSIVLYVLCFHLGGSVPLRTMIMGRKGNESRACDVCVSESTFWVFTSEMDCSW